MVPLQISRFRIPINIARSLTICSRQRHQISSGSLTFCFDTLRDLRDQSIFMGIRDREICNGTTGYLGPLVERGHRLFWGLALQGQGLFQCRISKGTKVILEYSQTGPRIILRLYRSFSYQRYGARANSYYGTNNYFGWRFQRGHAEFLTKLIRGRRLFCRVKSTGPR